MTGMRQVQTRSRPIADRGKRTRKRESASARLRPSPTDLIMHGLSIGVVGQVLFNVKYQAPNALKGIRLRVPGGLCIPARVQNLRLWRGPCGLFRPYGPTTPRIHGKIPDAALAADSGEEHGEFRWTPTVGSFRKPKDSRSPRGACLWPWGSRRGS